MTCTYRSLPELQRHPRSAWCKWGARLFCARTGHRGATAAGATATCVARQRKDLDSLVLPEAVHQVLEPLLAARDRPHVRVSAKRPVRQRRKVEAALEDLLAERLAPALVAALPGAREPPVLDHSLRREERTRADIHPSDMGMKQIDGVDRLAAQLRVEVQSAGSEAPACKMAYSPSVTSGTLFGNWSVSQPRSRSPRLMSTLPKMPNARAMAISCSKEWPARVEWLTSTLALTSFSSPKRWRKA